MSQVQAGAIAGVSEVTVRRIERNDETVEVQTLAKVAEAVGASFDWEKEQVVPPPGTPEARIEWAVRQLTARLAAAGKGVFEGAGSRRQAAKSKDQQQQDKIERKRGKGKE